MDYKSISKKQLYGKNLKDFTGWFASEKLDGWRVTFDNGKFVTKGGKHCKGLDKIARALTNYLQGSGMEKEKLEGELYLGREYRAKCSTICSGKKNIIVRIHENYTKIIAAKVYLFDYVGSGSFEQRHLRLKSALSELKGYYSRNLHTENTQKKLDAVLLADTVFLLEQTRIKNNAHLREMFESVVKKGGEGLVISDPAASYEAKRSDKKLKIKGRPDAECAIESTSRGSKGQLVLGCRTADNKFFKIGSGVAHSMTESDFPKGALITYSFENLTQDGVPQQTAFVGFRDKADMRKETRTQKSKTPTHEQKSKECQKIASMYIRNETIRLKKEYGDPLPENRRKQAIAIGLSKMASLCLSNVDDRCQKSTLSKYKNRPGPPYPAENCAVGTVKLGNNGLQYVVKKYSKGQRWVKA